MPHRVFIGIGSNLGERRSNCREAKRRIGELQKTRVVKESSLYESEPHGDAKTWFANSVLEIDMEIIEKRNLKVPHPRLAERRFVLLPLSELAPQMIHPSLGISVSEMLAKVRDDKKVHLMSAAE
jgi:7,8-dihydro-6-hydroxymethylpterin-pyrophosphokinase